MCHITTIFRGWNLVRDTMPEVTQINMNGCTAMDFTNRKSEGISADIGEDFTYERISQLDQMVLGDDLGDVFFDDTASDGGETPDISPAEPQSEPIPEPIIESEPEPIPEPVIEPEPEPTVEPEPIPEPVIEPEPEPIPEPIIEPEPEPIPEPVIEPEPEPIPEPIPEPKIETVSERIVEPVAAPAQTVSPPVGNDRTRYKEFKEIINKRYRDNTLSSDDVDEYEELIRPVVHKANMQEKLDEIDRKYSSVENSEEYRKKFVELKRLVKSASVALKGWDV